MVSGIDIEVVAAWLMTNIWAGRPLRELGPGMIPVDLPCNIQPEGFEAAMQRLIKIRMIDADFQITTRGTDARELPGKAATYEARFQTLLGELTQTQLPHEIHDLKRRIANDFMSFSQLVVMIAGMEDALRNT